MEKVGESDIRDNKQCVVSTQNSGEELCFVPKESRDPSINKRPAPIQESSSDIENDMSTPEGPASSNTDCTNEESMSSNSNKSCSTSVSSASSQNDENENESHDKATKRAKGRKPKKDRSKLRKGKWTVEEEEYTSRIIHYFISGLLTLPEGATLRSYLADKLNCDPMRITKKYAGASCLGRRVYHFRDRVHPTVGEIQVAKVELDHLEQRFRVRIEGGQSTWSASSPSDVAQALARQSGGTVDTSSGGMPQQIATTNTSVQAQNLLQSMLLGMGNQNPSASLPQQTPVTNAAAPTSLFGFPVAGVPGTVPTIPPALAQLLVPNAIAAGTEALGVQSQLLAAAPQMQGVDPSILNWAFSQAAASLGPALTHLAAANIQQAQQAQLQAQLQQSQQVQQQAQQQARLQAQQQAQLQAQQMLAQQKSQLQAQIREQQANVHQQLQKLQNQQQPTATTPPTTLPPPHTSPQSKPLKSDDRAKEFATELKQAFDRHMKSLDGTCEKEVTTSQTNEGRGPTDPVIATNAAVSNSAPTNSQQEQPRTDADNEGGTALLGFLSSLRKSYEDVVRDKQGFEGGKSESSYDSTSNRAAHVTDSNSTQQRDSSVEDSDWNSDWNSDKKTDPSSSEDSDKEVNHRDKTTHTSKGPPRKRMKIKKVADEVRKGPAN